MVAAFPGGSIGVTLTFLALPWVAMAVNPRSEFKGTMQFLVCFGAILLIIISVVIWLILIFGNDLETFRRTHNVKMEAEIMALRWFGIPFIIIIYMLYRYADSSWDTMSAGARFVLTLITVAPLPVTLYYTVWIVVALVIAVGILAIMAHAGTYPAPDTRRADIIGLQNTLRDIKKKLE